MKFYRCKDGYFSTTKNGCRINHDGLRMSKPQRITPHVLNLLVSKAKAKTTEGSRRGGASAAEQRPQSPNSKQYVEFVRLSDVHEDLQNFQNRKEKFSVRSVESILTAVENGAFKWSNFDPITLWQNPQNGKLYILSGHSRTEAFRKLAASGATAEGRKFDFIPAKIERSITLSEAKKIAMDSNTLSTKETDLERADYLRKVRNTEGGISRKDLENTAKRTEGANWTRILAYSFLNPHGKTYTAVKALQNAQDTAKTNIGVVAKWIGEARSIYPNLTNTHENELYDWLITSAAYGTKTGQISNEREFLDRLRSIINRKTTFGVLDEYLNIQSNVSKSPTEQSFDTQLKALQDEILAVDKQLKAKIQELAGRGAKENQIKQITEGLEATLRRKRIEYQKLYSRKSAAMEAAKGEMSLFDSIGRIANEGKTPCKDGKFSTTLGRGACAWHQGIKTNTPSVNIENIKKQLTEIAKPHTIIYDSTKDCFILSASDTVKYKGAFCYHSVLNPEYTDKRFPKRIANFILDNDLFRLYWRQELAAYKKGLEMYSNKMSRWDLEKYTERIEYFEKRLNTPKY